MKTSSVVRSQVLALTLLMIASFAHAQATDPAPEGLPPVAQKIGLSGPRFGATFLSPGIVEHLARENDIHVGSLVTQFGWQFEKRLYSGQESLTAVTEWVLLVGGVEQGVFLPSVNWLVGVRTKAGTEFGIGPNLSPAGSALVIAVGRTFRAGALNFPLNVAFVPSKSGLRVSVLCGFNTRR